MLLAGSGSDEGAVASGRRRGSCSTSDCPDLPLVLAIIAERGYRGLAKLAAHKHVRLDIKAPPKGTSGVTPLAPLYRVEHAFARLGQWRHLSRYYEGTEASA